MRLGAYDFLTKPIDPQHLMPGRRSGPCASGPCRTRSPPCASSCRSRYAFHNILSKSPRMHDDLRAGPATSPTPTAPC